MDATPTLETSAIEAGIEAGIEAAIQTPPAPQRRRRASSGEAGLGYLLILPTFGLTFLFSILPLCITVFYSFYSGTLLGTSHAFVGVQNYQQVLQGDGISSLAVTAKYTVGFVVLSCVLGLLVALVLNLRLKGIEAFRTFFIIPLVVPIVATGFVWVSLFNPFFGLVNRALKALGFPNIDWFNDPHVALVTVILFSTWQFFGQNVILFLAAIKAIPGEYLEASEIDGANPLQKFFRISLPLLVPSIALIVVLTTIAALQTFTQIYILTQGGPVGSTTTSAFYIYQQAFQLYNTGIADALATLLFIITMAITIFQMKVLKRFGAEGYE